MINLNLMNSNSISISKSIDPQNKYPAIINNLILIWKNEKLSSHLLKYEEEFITKTIELIEQKERELHSSREENIFENDIFVDENLSKEYKNLIELEIQRIKFIIVDYLRIRLKKIEVYLLDIIKKNSTEKLSVNEMRFAVDLINMKASYFNQSLKKLNLKLNDFINFKFKLPLEEKMKAINDGILVEEPKFSYVVAKNISGNNLTFNFKNLCDNFTGEQFVIIHDQEVHILPLELIKDKVESKEMQII